MCMLSYEQILLIEEFNELREGALQLHIHQNTSISDHCLFLGVFISFRGNPRMLQILLRLFIPQYLRSRFGNLIQIGNDFSDFVQRTKFGFHLFTRNDFLSKW